MAFDPKQCRVLLVGKLMARLEPFLKSKGYPHVESEELGGKALTLLASASYHLVLFDLILGDIELREFFLEARERQGDAAFILFASPGESEMIVSGLVLGADAYVPLPPDEEELFHVLERHGAAALARKSANPDVQPGVSAKLTALEAELEKARAQAADLEEQNALFDAEIARLNKLLEAARSEAAERPAAEAVPEGHKVVAIAAYEELFSRATFAEFLESENDELKKERDTLLARLKVFGLADEDEGGDDAFDEPTSASYVEDIALAAADRAPAAGGAAAIAPADADDGDDDDDGVELILEDDDGDELVLADDDGDELVLADDDGDGLVLADDDGDGLVLAEDAPRAPLATQSPAPPSFDDLPPTSSGEPEHVPPPGVDDDDDFDDFEDVNTDALLRLAGDMSTEGPSPDELEKLLASLDDE